MWSFRLFRLSQRVSMHLKASYFTLINCNLDLDLDLGTDTGLL